MGIYDRYPDWKEKDENEKGHYQPEQPSYGHDFMYCDYCGNEIKPSKARKNTGGNFSVVIDTIPMPFICKRCGGSFCSKHRLPENHDCGGLKPPIIIVNDIENNVNKKESTPVSENKTNHICQFCFKSIEHYHKCQKCGLELCQDHIYNHSCIGGAYK